MALMCFWLLYGLPCGTIYRVVLRHAVDFKPPGYLESKRAETQAFLGNTGAPMCTYNTSWNKSRSDDVFLGAEI